MFYSLRACMTIRCDLSMAAIVATSATGTDYYYYYFYYRDHFGSQLLGLAGDARQMG